jgi:hypothetical protein
MGRALEMSIRLVPLSRLSSTLIVSIQNPIKVHGIHGINRNDKSNQSGPFSQNALKRCGSPGGHPLFGNGDATFSS